MQILCGVHVSTLAYFHKSSQTKNCKDMKNGNSTRSKSETKIYQRILKENIYQKTQFSNKKKNNFQKKNKAK